MWPGARRLRWIVVLLLIVAGGCQHPDPDYVEPPQCPDLGAPLRIGTTPNLPPIMYTSQGRVVGLEADMARALSAAWCRPIRFVRLPWAELLPALRDGRVDIVMAGMSITPARQSEAAFTQPYLRIGQLALLRAVDQRKYDQVSILVSRVRIGVEKGTTGDAFVTQYCRLAQRVPFDSAAEGAQAVIRGEIDLFVDDAPVVWWLAARHTADGLAFLNAYLTLEVLAWAVRPQDQALLRDLNQVLAAWEKNGVLDSLLEKWVPFYK